MSLITEEQVELQSIEWFKELGYQYRDGYEIAPEGESPERNDFRQVILEDRLRSALIRINPDIPNQTIQNSIPQILNPNIPSLLNCNREMHKLITKGLKVAFMQNNDEVGRQLKLIDFENIDNNDWLVVNQFEIQGDQRLRRPDVLVFVNGLPLGVIELKNPADVHADIWSAYNQLQTYKDNIPDLFNTNGVLVISDGIQARMGSLTATQERFMRWRTINGEVVDPLGAHQDLETLIRGLFNKETFLNYIRYFCIFEDDKSIIKKIAGYHQFYAVQKALEKVVEASQVNGDKKGGVVWHTQGAGKSLEMTCLAGQIVSDIRLGNPTIVMVTDRQDLDGQLFGVFNDAGDLLGESPKQANSIKELKDLLSDRPSGGIIFTTIQKFRPEKDEEKFSILTDRHNVIVMCDEAHRTQYGFKGVIDQKTGQMKYGLARALRDGLPNATFLAFTGTPISQDDRDTQAVFGEYVDIYDIQQAVDDGATVPIYYESRLAKIKLDDSKIPVIDDEVEVIFEDGVESDEQQEKAKSKWSQMEALVGAKPRLQEVAKDLIEHFGTRSKTQPGKAMIIGMSRDICARLYEELILLKPEWDSNDHMKGGIKVVMTASASDAAHLQKHHTSKQQKKDLEKRFKDPSDELKIVIVRDMWLTGFDAPCLTTMYVDKPMQGANLAQAIARVNRVFADKPGGLIVDYIGIAPQLKEALATYSGANGKGRPTIDASEALKILEEKLMVARDLLHPIDWSDFRNKALQLLPECIDHILEQEDGRKRYCDTVLSITRAFALCGAMEEAQDFADKVAFHQAIRGPLIKTGRGGGRGDFKDTDFELKQLVSESLVADGVSDIFKMAGIKTPDISILSEEFLKEVQKMPQKNLAVELLNKLINDQVKSRFKTNIVKQKKFSDLLQNALSKYQNRSIEAAQVIAELIEMAKEFKKDIEKTDELNLDPAENAFYDALSNNKSAEDLMGEEVLIEIAREVAEKLRQNISVDWSVRESVRARLRLIVKNLLRKYKYPPDDQDEAVELVLSQAEMVSEELVA
ncbi:type I restriction endonuclease subunit R [Gammaproteobacteria bacterium]|nr:type I restriction endonuclease subunit R [Gammaproteobacteria bacterium]